LARVRTSWPSIGSQSAANRYVGISGLLHIKILIF
jgi:hypothetical protein